MTRRQMLIWSMLALLVGAGLRFHAMNQDVRFHPDEALFSSFARDAAVHGEWMLPGPLDKPPLTIYASALSMHFLSTFTNDLSVLDMTNDQGEFAARLPNVFAGLVLMALTGALAGRRSETSRLAVALTMFLAAASPYLIVFAASAFTDAMMVTLGTASLLAVISGRGWMAGVLLALSIASKQQGMVYLPLLVLLAWQRDDRLDVLRGLLIALSAGLLMLLMWDMTRSGTSIFTLASANNSPQQLLAAPDTWLSRLRLWVGYAGWLIGSPLITWPLLMLSAYYTLRKRERLDQLLWLFVIGYFLVHWLLAFNTYDRYVLPLAPIVLILSGRAITSVRFAGNKPVTVRLALTLLLFAMLATGILASRWRFDLGRDHYPLDRQGEINALAAHLNQKPPGTIVYDPWLGWELGYYLGPWSNKRRVHYPTPEALINDALDNPEGASRYFLAPSEHNVTAWLNAMKRAGLVVREDYRSARFIVYRLTFPQAASDASGVAASCPGRVVAAGDAELYAGVMSVGLTRL